MFKELGEFIDDVGRATGRIIKRGINSLLPDDKPDDDGIDGIMGYAPKSEISVKLKDREQE